MRQLCSAVSSSGTRKNTTAPTTGPHSRPAPPSTTISRKKIEKSAVKSSGVTTVFWTANRAPANPAIAALTTKAIILMRTSDTPAAVAATGLSRTATSARPKRERSRLAMPSSASTFNVSASQ